MKVGGKRSRLVVVKDFAMIEHGASNAQIEDAGVAVAAAAFDGGNVGVAVLVDKHLHHGLIDSNVVEVPLPLKDGYDADACQSVPYLEQGRACIGTRSVDRNAINVQAQVRQVEGIVLNLDADAESLLRLLLGGAQDVVVKSGAMQQDRNDDDRQQEKDGRDCVEPPGGFDQPLITPAGKLIARTLGMIGSERERAWLTPQNACPMLMKYCVALTPSMGFRLRPTSRRIGPTGVEYRRPRPTLFE